MVAFRHLKSNCAVIQSLIRPFVLDLALLDSVRRNHLQLIHELNASVEAVGNGELLSLVRVHFHYALDSHIELV